MLSRSITETQKDETRRGAIPLCTSHAARYFTGKHLVHEAQRMRNDCQFWLAGDYPVSIGSLYPVGPAGLFFKFDDVLHDLNGFGVRERQRPGDSLGAGELYRRPG